MNPLPVTGMPKDYMVSKTNQTVLNTFIPFPNHPCTLSASLAVRLYCRRFAFAFTNDVEMELLLAISRIVIWLHR